MVVAAAVLVIVVVRPWTSVDSDISIPEVPAALAQADPGVRDHVASRYDRARQVLNDHGTQADYGIALAANGFWESARPAFDRAARLDASEPLAAFYGARASVEVNDADDARRRLEAVTTRWPKFAPAHYLLGTLLLERGDLEDAAARFRAVASIEGDQSSWGKAGLASVFLQQGHPEQAAALLEPTVERDPQFALARYLLGTAYRALKKPELAARHLAAGLHPKGRLMPDAWSSRLMTEARSVGGRVHEAQVLQGNGRLTEAIAILEGARTNHANELDLLSNLGGLYIDRNDLPRAVEVLEHAESVNPRHLPTLLNLANAESKAGHHDAAVRRSMRAIDAAPSHPRAYEMHADVLAAMDRRDEALNAMRTAIRLDPANAQLRLRLGGLLSRFSRLPEAKAEVEASVSLDPSNPKAWMVLCELCMNMTLTQEAVQAFERARTLAPRAPELAILERRLRALGVR